MQQSFHGDLDHLRGHHPGRAVVEVVAQHDQIGLQIGHLMPRQRIAELRMNAAQEPVQSTSKIQFPVCINRRNQSWLTHTHIVK